MKEQTEMAKKQFAHAKVKTNKDKVKKRRKLIRWLEDVKLSCLYWNNFGEVCCHSLVKIWRILCRADKPKMMIELSNLIVFEIALTISNSMSTYKSIPHLKKKHLLGSCISVGDLNAAIYVASYTLCCIRLKAFQSIEH